jgi:hypothetical protein
MYKYKLFEIMDEKTLDILSEKYPQDIFLIKNGMVAIEISAHNRWFEISKDNNLKLRQYLIPEKDIIEILKYSYDLNINTDNLRNSYAIDRIDSHNEYALC